MRALVAGVLVSLSLAAGAHGDAGAGDEAPLAVDSIPLFELPDPDDGELTPVVAPGVRFVLYTRERSASDRVVAALRDAGRERLAARGARFVVDTGPIPAVVRRFIVHPAIRDLPYPVWIDESSEATRDIPTRAGAATWLELGERADGRVAVVTAQALDSVEAIDAALGVGPERDPEPDR